MSTTEQKDMGTLIKELVKAAKAMRKAEIELEEAYGLQLIEGFRITGSGRSRKIEIQVHRGIDDIIETMGLDHYDEPKEWGFAPRRYTVVHGVRLFQTGTEAGYYYERAKKKEAST